VTEQQGPHAKTKTELIDGSNWFSVTGHLVPGEPTAIVDRQHEAEAYYGEWRRRTEGPKRAAPDPGGGIGWSDQDILRLARFGAGGWSAERFRGLYDEGDLTGCHGDHSSGDYRLCIRLSGWTGFPYNSA
jgi:hypothetical protein